MPLESYADLVNDAKKRRYAVGAFNIFNVAFLPAIIEAAEEESAPVILQINPIHYAHFDLPNYMVYVKSQIARAEVPVGLNLDHGKTKDVVLQGIRSGFPSVMYDGSKHPFEENVTRTGEIVSLCRPDGITVEAELGTLNDEGLELNADTIDLLFTDPGKAAEFVDRTGIDALAVAIGNAHGFYRGKPQLDFARLATIRDKVPVPLVLHGGSDIPDEDIRKVISLGIAKINIYTEISAAASQCMRGPAAVFDGPPDYPTLLGTARREVNALVKQKIRLFGGSGMA